MEKRSGAKFQISPLIKTAGACREAIMMMKDGDRSGAQTSGSMLHFDKV